LWAALNHCVLALAALGWHSRIQRFPDRTDPWHLASIAVEPSRPSEADVALAAAITRRRTDRRVFGPWPVAPGDVALMVNRAARMGVTMRWVQPAAALKAMLARAIREHVDDVDYLAELAVWSGRLFAGASLAQPPNADVADDNGMLLALGTASDDALARLRAGEATARPRRLGCRQRRPVAVHPTPGPVRRRGEARRIALRVRIRAEAPSSAARCRPSPG